MTDKISLADETIIVTDFEKDALDKSEKREKLVENNIFHTNLNRLVMKMRSLQVI